MRVDEIRERFLNFFEKRGHKIYPSDSLLPSGDPTLLFTGAGMNQFKDEFLGKVKGPRRATTCQKCLRTGDLDKVGKTPGHHTFFEMLGNFSFGDYFKKEAVRWAWEFLTEELGLKEGDLWVSVYEDDNEAYKIWKDDIRVPAEKILKFDARENFWPANAPTDGPNGPCGPCSEIFYGGRDGVEVWNLVFTQFDRKETGKLEPLPNKNIDTGMGLERVARVLQGKKTNFQIDAFVPIIDTILDSSRPFDRSQKGGGRSNTKSVHAIADHIRAITFAIADGILPSNEERGYVIRKLIRRAFWYGRALGLDEPFLYKIVPIVAKVMKRPYPELTQKREDIAGVVLKEEERFRNTLKEGLERLEEELSGVRSKGILPGEYVFKLYDTYGFPVELTQEIAESQNIKLDIEGFRSFLEEQRIKSKKSSRIKDAIFGEAVSIDLGSIKQTVFIEDKEELKSEVIKIVVSGKEKREIKEGEGGILFFKETNFYGEKGGQVGDAGVLLKSGKEVAEVIDAKDSAGRVEHVVKMKGLFIALGDTVTLKVSMARRENIKKNHTATHLLHYALRKVLGEHVRQAGSLVAPERLRFDFTHYKALTDEEKRRVEEIVNENIKKNSPVEAKELGLDEAKREGAIALFGEKYGALVRMVCVGGYSKELCGGTHVGQTKDIGLFKILEESSIASGIRRIEALTGELAHKKVKEERDLIERVAGELGTDASGILKAIEKLQTRLKELERHLSTFSERGLERSIKSLLKKPKKFKGVEVIISELKNLDMRLLRKSADMVKEGLSKGVFVLLSEKDDRLSMVVGVKDRDLNAVLILNDIGKDFGLRGGGRGDFAQAGGRSGPEVRDILKKAEGVVKRNL